VPGAPNYHRSWLGTEPNKELIKQLGDIINRTKLQYLRQWAIKAKSDLLSSDKDLREFHNEIELKNG
jgi:hypothetical protein